VRQATFGAVRRLNTRPGRRPSIDHELRHALSAEFAGEVRRLEALLGRELSTWPTALQSATSRDLAAA
jgi:hypothetical protein